ncbi:MAG: chromosome segregation protein SMC, partial [Lachnospiraceae bacterium]|nr:chromosome segregation protein SMC [Lachnospiraceae bacterium]
MYLKKIEAQGFKSFANKTVLEFYRGIMGIVGPNGSGKSNVADAVRWVLGEQSARQLRGSNMQDVIFAGTESRKPQGFASVALTIDNSDHMLAVDFDEVTVARRVYRSGESEYLLNGHLCRLRDIQELFYDTGVGKEGYSIIGQGQIDKILSGRPEDRRELFDEAAGIVKFKRRRHITEKKLETEEGNLVRVTDILHELEKQVGPLERQSEKARQYLKWKDELKQADLQAYCLESAEYKRRLAEAEKNLSIVQEDRDHTKRQSEEMKDRYDALTEERSEAESRLTASRNLLAEKKVHREKLEGQIRILEEQIQAARASGEQVRERIAVLEQEAQAKEEQRETLAEQREELVRKRDEREREADRLSREQIACQAAIRQRELHLEDSQRQQRELLEEKAELGASLKRCETMLEQVQNRVDETERLAGEERQRGEELAAQTGTLTAQLAEREAEEQRQKDALDEAVGALETAEWGLKDHNRRASSLDQKYHSLKSRRDSLVNLTERYEGYGSSIRRVMEKKKNTPGIRGVVADLFHTDRAYETALETALGGRIQNIVTDTEQTARDLIGYLKRNRLGRATFLPLSSVRGKNSFPRPEALREPGALGIASELVQTEEEYRGIAAHLLGRYLVVDTIDHALAIAARYKYSLNLVTLEGELLSPGGAMTGGSYRNNSNLLGRRREIDELAKSIRQVQNEQEQCRLEIRTLEQQITQIRGQMEALRQETHRLELEKNTLSMDLARLHSEAETLQKESLDREAEREHLFAELDEWEQERKELTESLEELEQSLAGLTQGGEADGDRLEEQRSRLEELTAQIAAVRQEAVSLEQKAGFLGENLNRLHSESENARQEAGELQQSLAGGEEQAVEKERTRDELRVSVEDETAACSSLEQQMEQQISEQETLAARQKKIFDDREDLNARLSDLDRELYRLQNSAERLEDQIAKQADYIWKENERPP